MGLTRPCPGRPITTVWMAEHHDLERGSEATMGRRHAKQLLPASCPELVIEKC